MNNILIYGAYGYTGQLIVEQAVEKGWKPMVAGRNEVLIRQLAEKHGLRYACFKFDDQLAWDKVLKDKDLLINCAGPFGLTIKNILPACLRNEVHYADITGEIDVFQFIEKHDEEAKQKNIVLMPGIGFDVVPTDCLAVFLHKLLPSATHLTLAFDSSSGLSRGTALSVLNRFHKGSAVRENGIVKELPAAVMSRTICFSGKDKNVVGIGWGDVFTAFYSTGIPNIEVFTAMPEKTMKIMKRAGRFSWLIKQPIIQKIGAYFIRKKVHGPSKHKRDNSRCYVWGRVEDANGKWVQAELETPESYKLTAITAIICAEKILSGKATAGFKTPAQAFGSDLIMEVSGVTRHNQ